MPQAAASLQAGQWNRSAFTGVELLDKVAGILGLGRIGTLVADRLAAFGMRVIAYDPYLAPARAAQAGVHLVSLDELLAESDVISVHLPKNAETAGLLGARELARVKPGVLIINAARGGILDEAALARALASGRVRGAGLDVYATEPPDGSPLLRLPSVVATPHLGASTAEAQEKAGVQVARSVRLALDGEFVPEAVNVQGGPVDETIRPGLPLAEKLGAIFTALAGGIAASLELEVRGEIAALDVSVLQLAALRGVFGRIVEDPVTYVNAPLLAKERGIEVTLTASPDSPDWRNVVTLRGVLPDGQVISVGGTLTGRRQQERLVEVNGFEMEIAPAEHMAFFTYTELWTPLPPPRGGRRGQRGPSQGPEPAQGHHVGPRREPQGQREVGLHDARVHHHRVAPGRAPGCAARRAPGLRFSSRPPARDQHLLLPHLQHPPPPATPCAAISSRSTRTGSPGASMELGNVSKWMGTIQRAPRSRNASTASRGSTWAWLQVGARVDRRDGQERQVDPREAGARLPEALRHVRGVAAEVDRQPVVLDDVAGEARVHPRLVDPPAEPGVLHGHGGDPQPAVLEAVVQRGSSTVSKRKSGTHAEPFCGSDQDAHLALDHRRASRWTGGRRACARSGRRRRAAAPRARGRAPPGGATTHADRLGEDRVGQDELVVHLDQRGGVPDPEHGEPRVVAEGVVGPVGRGRGRGDEGAGVVAEHAARGAAERRHREGELAATMPARSRASSRRR